LAGGELKADLVSLDAARAVLVGAGLALIAGGIVSAALWFVWKLAEIVP